MPDVTYADWKAPKQDEATLVWPDPATLKDLISRNHSALAQMSTPILGIPAAEVRRTSRAFLNLDDATPYLLTGHQTELHHPGVWIKNAVVHHLALAVSGRAAHLAVDTDAPKHLLLRYPTSRDGQTPSASTSITDDPTAHEAAFTGWLAGPTPAHAMQVEKQFAADASTFGFAPAAADVLASLRRAAMQEDVLPKMLAAAMHELDWSLGLRYDALLASPLWSSDAFLLFAAHLIANADRYAASYNAALADYRAQEGITNPGRPMPDLAAEPERIELPFWLDDMGTGQRNRPTARKLSGQWGIEFAGERFTPAPEGGWDAARTLRDLLRKANHRLAPRALTLTTFSRLLLSDVFVHGIGGGRYDQVTDRIFRSFFETEPPAFIVATGTLYFPWAAERTRACLPCVKREGHRLNHALLGSAKQKYLTTIAAAGRRTPERKQAFLEMHDALTESRKDNDRLADWSHRLRQTQLNAEQDTVIFDRELFYALQPKDRLTSWIEKVGHLLLP